MKVQKILYRTAFYLMGLLVLAFGVAFSVNSNLGVSPVNSLPYVLSVVTPVPMGACVVIIFSLYILVQILVLRKKFKWINLAQVLFSTVFGYFVNFAKMILGDFTIPTYAGQLVMLAISIVLVALGVAMYVGTKLINMPMEGMAMAIAQKMPGKTFPQVKIVLDCIVVFAAAALSLVCLRTLDGVREGTVLCALLVGPLIKPIQKALYPWMHKFCFDQPTQPTAA